MFTYKRSERVKGLMLEVINEIVKNEVKDPRIGFVTITRVELTDNLRSAKVYISPMGTEAEQVNTFKGISSAAPFIRSRLGKKIRLKVVPEISFKWDHGQVESDKISRLLHELDAGEKPAVEKDIGNE